MRDANGSGSGTPPSGPPPGPLSGSTARPPRRRGWLPALIGVLVLAVGVAGLLAGTGAFRGGDGGETPAPPAPSSAAGTTTASGTPPPGTSPAAGLLPFGRTHRFPDGVEVTVSAPERFTPADTSAGHKDGNIAVKVEVTVRNGSGERLDLVTVVVRGRDGDGREAVRVFDAGQNVMALSGGLLPGRKAVADHGFDLPPPAADPFEVEVNVGFDGDSAFWGGAVP
ncbi:hypothetical protein [Streptomyces sp. NPDC057854]|uniref:hypothetical protein n=1 Tax=unclassified Streptomyces TaxID=2593676 RepID=UPI003697DC5B